jgi:hypothetical protein
VTRSDEMPLEPTPGADEAVLDATLGALGSDASVADVIVAGEVAADAAAVETVAAPAGDADTDHVHHAVQVGAAAEPAGGWWSRWKYRTTQGAPIYPLGVLFGLNMVDELDRTAFGVLLPEIRDHYGLDNNGILTVVSLSLVAALILALPIGFYADRWRRVPIAGVGASIWGFFSVLTGLAPTLWMLGAARAGAGLGRAVNDPVHNSLLADYYA